MRNRKILEKLHGPRSQRRQRWWLQGFEMTFRGHWKRGNHPFWFEFSFRHVEFEMLMEHLGTSTRWTVGKSDWVSRVLGMNFGLEGTWWNERCVRLGKGSLGEENGERLGEEPTKPYSNPGNHGFPLWVSDVTFATFLLVGWRISKVKIIGKSKEEMAF